ncbi:MAG: hypothetical protein IPM07_30450 [Anaerolineales bacterium]|nr:hypothetical protein [Anaerolineales bacterium]
MLLAPAPNDRTEIGNHSEFLGITKMSDMLAMFFVHANKEMVTEVNGVKRRKLGNDSGQEWRLKHHAEQPFYRWMASWAMSIRQPSRPRISRRWLYLAAVRVNPVWIDYDICSDDQLNLYRAGWIIRRSCGAAKRCSNAAEIAAELVNASDEQWIVWTGLNDESSLMAELIPDSIEVVGADSPEDKATAIGGFQDGNTGARQQAIDCGFGMNFQNAHNQIFVGLSYSWD